MAKKIAFNTTEVACVVDDDGRSIPGLERAEVDSTNDLVKQAIEAGRLVWAETPTDGK